MQREWPFHTRFVNGFYLALKVEHCIAAMAATFCHSIGAKKLILTHFSQRYKSADEDLKLGEKTVELLEKEAIQELKRIDPNSTVDVCTADDLHVYAIPARTDHV